MSGSGWILMIACWMAVTGIALWLVGRLFPPASPTRPRSRLRARLRQHGGSDPPEKTN